jgi:Ca2+-transporting ATPase
MGTLVTGGGGDAMVVATGYETELGRIQRLVGEAHAPETPMQRQLGTMGTQLAILSGAVCAGVFVIGILRGQSFLQMLKGAISLAVAAVPEGLPAVATTTLAMGIRNMGKRKVAIRHIDAVETLGSVQVLCLDKTGTLTINRMSVVAIALDGRQVDVRDEGFFADDRSLDPRKNEHLTRLLQLISLCSDSQVNGDGRLDGTPTENAMVQTAIDGGVDVRALRRQHPRRQVQERAEDRPYMATLHATDEDQHLVAVKGSPDDVLGLCDYIQQDGDVVVLDADARERILAENDGLASKGLRVLGVAYAYMDTGSFGSLERLVWVGLVGMADPLRPGMKQLMGTFHRAGIHTVMITGDQTATAYHIGKELNLSQGKPLQILDSTKLQKLDPKLLAGVVKKTHVFARVNPAHKLQIVQALQGSGQVVAMTGDGINDGPALKAADIGIAMGGAQNDVARSVADVVVEDDNLNTLVNAVSQGRTIYSNIRKTIHYLLSTNLSEIEMMLASITLGLGQPLNPMQLLWINLISDIFPGLALSMEAAEPDVLRRAPRASEEQIIRREDLLRMLRESGVITGASLASYLYGRMRYGAGSRSNTLAFNSLVLAQLLHAVPCRSDTHSIYSRGTLPPNPALRWAIGTSLGIQLLAMLLPGTRKLLGVTPLSLLDSMVVAGGAGVPLLINEALKHNRVAVAGQSKTPKKSNKTRASAQDEK